jgi:hypothetical protein
MIRLRPGNLPILIPGKSVILSLCSITTFAANIQYNIGRVALVNSPD